MCPVWDGPERVGEFTKRRAVPEEEQSHLRVRKFSELFEELRGFVDSLLGVVVTELCGSDGAPK